MSGHHAGALRSLPASADPLLEGLHDPYALNVGFGMTALGRFDDPELDELLDEVGVDPGA
jgi:hypothetical protein